MNTKRAGAGRRYSVSVTQARFVAGVEQLQHALPHDTIMPMRRQFSTWAHRFWRYAGLRTQLAPTAAAWATAAGRRCGKDRAPERTVSCSRAMATS